MRPTIMPLLLGWILSVWLPVPSLVRTTVGTAAAAVLNGVHAAAATLHHK